MTKYILLFIVIPFIAFARDYSYADTSYKYKPVDIKKQRWNLPFRNIDIDSAKSYPKIINDLYVYESIVFTNCRFTGNFKEFKLLQDISEVCYQNCDTSMYSSIRELHYLKNLISLGFDECPKVELSNTEKPLDSLAYLSFYYCDTVIITKNFIDKAKITHLSLNFCQNVFIEDGIVIDTLKKLGIQYYPSRHKRNYKGVNELLKNLKYAESITIGTRDLTDFDVHENAHISKMDLGFINISVLPNNFYTIKGIKGISLRGNLLTDFRFDYLKPENFDFETEFLEKTNEVSLSLEWNFIDSIRAFTDTAETHFYEIQLDYNNRKLKEEFAPIEDSSDNYYNTEYYDFTLPKGIFNLQFRGKLSLCGYNLSELEKQKIREHFKYAEVEFDTPFK